MTSGRPEVLIADNKLEALSQIFDFSQVLKTCRPDIYQDKVCHKISKDAIRMGIGQKR